MRQRVSNLKRFPALGAEGIGGSFRDPFSVGTYPTFDNHMLALHLR
ncbi:hypothetical protein PAMC26577_11320 [Caballeronia sordidicola]|uniref:Uncharacterized protein n=1 Tax=Caballeronia sordidicola TaxID=196367 RepID=A0A242MZF2_CABSO|nr:hypothetical protein PAMC26577_11320 [Caballeronia sordidicola]